MSFHVEFHLPGFPGNALNVFGGWWEEDPKLFLHISFIWFKMSFHVEFHLPGLPGSALKVFGDGWWVLKLISVLSFGPNLWFRLWIWTWIKLNNCDQKNRGGGSPNPPPPPNRVK